MFQSMELPVEMKLSLQFAETTIQMVEFQYLVVHTPMVVPGTTIQLTRHMT